MWATWMEGDGQHFDWFKDKDAMNASGHKGIQEYGASYYDLGNGSRVFLNPNGPHSDGPAGWEQSNNPEYFTQGWYVGRTPQPGDPQITDGGIDMMQNQAFDIAIGNAGGKLLSAAIGKLAGAFFGSVLGRAAGTDATEGITTLQGTFTQATSAEALAAREAVEGGATLYRGGILAQSAGPEGQFWSLEHPLSPGYAGRMGVPPENTPFNFIEFGKLNPGSRFVTTPAPGVGSNAGNGIQVVTESLGVRLRGFSQP